MHEDEYTTFKLLHEAKRIGVIDEPLYYYFVRKDSIMGEFKESRFDVFDGYVEKMRCFMEWNESKLATKCLLHAMHMLCQYKEWNEVNNKELSNLVQKYRNKIILEKKKKRIPVNGKSKLEYILFSMSFTLYFKLWKLQRK